MKKNIRFNKIRYLVFLKYQFDELKEIWYNSTMLYSSATMICGHPSYDRIIELGPYIVPFILEEVIKGHWLWNDALTKFTGHRLKLNSSEQGKIKIICGKWVKWGKENGYL